MAYQLILIVVALIICVIVIRRQIQKTKTMTCPKCDGAGSWRATRGEKVICNVCGGTGRVPRQ